MPRFWLQDIRILAFSPYTRNDFSHFHKRDMPQFFSFCHRLIPFPCVDANDRTHIAIVKLESIKHRNIFFTLSTSLYPFIPLLVPQIGWRDKRAYPRLFLLLFLFPNTHNRRVNHLAPFNAYYPFSQFGTL